MIVDVVDTIKEDTEREREKENLDDGEHGPRGLCLKETYCKG